MPAFETIDSKIYKKLFIILEGVHIAGYLVSTVRQKMLKMRYQILIENEGFALKLLADLWFESVRLEVEKNSVANTFLQKITNFLVLQLVRSQSIIIFLDADYGAISKRCLHRASGIEPLDYILFQSKFYNMLFQRIPKDSKVTAVKITAESSIKDINKKVCSLVIGSL